MRKIFGQALDRKFWLIFNKKIITENHYITIWEPVRNECSSCKVPRLSGFSVRRCAFWLKHFPPCFKHSCLRLTHLISFHQTQTQVLLIFYSLPLQMWSVLKIAKMTILTSMNSIYLHPRFKWTRRDLLCKIIFNDGQFSDPLEAGYELCLYLASCVCVLCSVYVRHKYNVRRHG